VAGEGETASAPVCRDIFAGLSRAAVERSPLVGDGGAVVPAREIVTTAASAVVKGARPATGRIDVVDGAAWLWAAPLPVATERWTGPASDSRATAGSAADGLASRAIGAGLSSSVEGLPWSSA
jgi:hypothetical protein